MRSRASCVEVAGRAGPAAGSRRVPLRVTVPPPAGPPRPGRRVRVVLPAPLRPTRPTRSPGADPERRRSKQEPRAGAQLDVVGGDHGDSPGCEAVAARRTSAGRHARQGAQRDTRLSYGQATGRPADAASSTTSTSTSAGSTTARRRRPRRRAAGCPGGWPSAAGGGIVAHHRDLLAVVLSGGGGSTARGLRHRPARSPGVGHGGAGGETSADAEAAVQHRRRHRPVRRLLPDQGLQRESTRCGRRSSRRARR